MGLRVILEPPEGPLVAGPWVQGRGRGHRGRCRAALMKEEWQVVSKVGGWYLEGNVPWSRWQREREMDW